MEVLPAPLEGASVSLRKNDGGSNDQRCQQERSSLPIPAPSPPPQTISSGDSNSSGTSQLTAARSQDNTASGYQKGSESTPLIGVGPECPTFISSPTRLLTISTELSPTEGLCRGSLASAASGSPRPAGYSSSSYKRAHTLAPVHAASPSVGAFTPHSNTFGVYPSTQPLYMTTRPAAALAAGAECGSQLASNTAGLPQGQIRTEDHHLQRSEGGYGYGGPASKETSCGGASFASLDSSSFFAITQPPPSSAPDATHPELERMLLRGSPVTAPPAAGGAQMPMITAATQQQQTRHQTTVTPGPLRDFDTFDGRLVDGGTLDDFPAVVGGLCGGYVGGCYDSSDESSGDNAGGRGHSAVDGGGCDREFGSSKLGEGGDEDKGESTKSFSAARQREYLASVALLVGTTMST